MSWGEVKKINSNLSVPLDTLIGNLRLNNSNVYLSDRMQYVGGIIPRNTIPKIITPEANNGVVYEYSGKTIINSLSFSVSTHHTDNKILTESVKLHERCVHRAFRPEGSMPYLGVRLFIWR